MTLRILLAHRAGFPHEAPVGNNHDVANMSFAEHVASISETWLKFPVGQQYGYSNLGIDLAGHILEVLPLPVEALSLPFLGSLQPLGLYAPAAFLHGVLLFHVLPPPE